jgi:MFS family permease
MDDSALSTPPGAVPAAPRSRLFNRDFVLLWQGQAISQIGDQAFSLAMALWVAEKTGSASLMGLLLTVGSIGVVSMGPFGGVAADRWPRMRIIVACDLIGAVTMLAVALLILTGHTSIRVTVALLIVASAVLGVIRGFFMPAVNAALPDLVPAERLAAANSLTQFAFQASLLLGQGVGGILYRVLGAPLLFLADGVSFLLAAVSESFVRLPPVRAAVPAISASSAVPAGERPGAFGQFRAELKEGLRYTLDKPGLLGFMLSVTAYNFFFMPVFVLLPFFVRNRLNAGPEWYGFLLAAVSIGAILGFILAGVMKLQGAARSWVVMLTTLLAPVPFLVGFARSTTTALACAVFLGVMVGIINVNFATIIQETTPPELRGRVMGLLTTLAGSLTPISFALGGMVGDLTHKNVPLVYTTCAAASFLFSLAAFARRSTRTFIAAG